MRILLLIGRLTYQDFLALMRDLDSVEICGVLSAGRNRPKDWDPINTTLPTWTYEQLDGVEDLGKTPLHDRYQEVLSQTFSDSRSFFLIDRLYGRDGAVSVFNNARRLEQIIWNSITILYHTKPDRIIGTNTPHNVEWFICRVAEQLGVDVTFTQTSPLPWRTWVVRGTDEQSPVTPEVPDRSMEESALRESILDFIRKQRSSYDVAIPAIEKQRIERYNQAYFSFRIELRSVLSGRSLRSMIWRAYLALNKRAMLMVYNKHSANFKLPANYVVFFPHFQPERTTLPEGYQYVQQWLVIRAISSVLPTDWTLVVKEHPSTFRVAFARSFREKDFYRSIARLRNTCLAPLTADPFELIDRSLAVATVTGKVGVEALIRGKPVLVFGAAQYRGAKGVFAVQNVNGVRDAIDRIAAGDVMPTDEELMDYFLFVARSSFPKDSRINGSIAALRLATGSSPTKAESRTARCESAHRSGNARTARLGNGS